MPREKELKYPELSYHYMNGRQDEGRRQLLNTVEQKNPDHFIWSAVETRLELKKRVYSIVFALMFVIATLLDNNRKDKVGPLKSMEL